jgi:Zn-dependent peptidase ImmA (M78 family)
MNQLLPRIREAFPHFNERAVTEEDFWRAAKREKIIVRSMPLVVDGYYQRKNGRHFILINRNLTGVAWLFAALHEFCHYLFHEPCGGDNYVLYRNGRPHQDSRERQADAFALIALIPATELKQARLAHAYPDEWAEKVLAEREKIYWSHRI